MTPEEPFDMDVALSYLADDRAIFEGFAAVFIRESTRQFREMRAAIAMADAQLVARVAHNMKGSASTLGAKRAFDAAHRLEVLGDEGRFADMLPALLALEHEMDLLEAALTKAIKGPSSADSSKT